MIHLLDLDLDVYKIHISIHICFNGLLYILTNFKLFNIDAFQISNILILDSCILILDLNLDSMVFIFDSYNSMMFI